MLTSLAPAGCLLGLTKPRYHAAKVANSTSTAKNSAAFSDIVLPDLLNVEHVP